MTTTTTTNPAELLRSFAFQRPGLDPRDYGGGREGWNSYRRESAEITRDMHDFCELFALASVIVSDLSDKIGEYLRTSSGRLTITDAGKLQYITGQYFPTEYRPACCRVLVSIMWREVMKQYETGDQIRAYFRRRVSRRVAKYYFN